MIFHVRIRRKKASTARNVKLILDHLKSLSLLRKTALFMMLIVIVIFTSRFLVGMTPFVNIVVAMLTITMFGSIYLFTPRFLDYEIAARLMVFTILISVLVSSYFTGALESSIIVTLPVIPLLAVLLIGGKKSWIIFSMTLLSVVVFLGMHTAEVAIPPTTLSTNAEIMFRAGWIISTILIVMVVLYYFADENDRLKALLQHKANTDPLTELVNRRTIDDRLREELQRLRRSQSELSILLIDIDHFKLLNDEMGHQAGDDCLVRIADIMLSHFRRAGDEVSRIGGEEFLVLLPDTSNEKAIFAAEKLRQAIEEENIFRDNNRQNKITVSVGVVTTDGKHSIEAEQLLKMADDAMYQGKDAGRNQVRSANINH